MRLFDFAAVRVTPPCELCGALAGQRRLVHLDACVPGCDGVHVACNACITAAGIDPATCELTACP